MSVSRTVEDASVQPIPIDEFLARPVVLVDTFIRLVSGKFILIAKAGQATSETSLEKYRARNLDSLYVHVDDYHRFLVSNAQAAKDVADSGVKLKKDTRAAILQDAMTTVYREVGEMGFSDQSFARAKLVNHALMGYVKDNSALADLIQKFGATSGEGVAHSMMVSMVSVMLGMRHDWVKPATLEKLSLGGFLHDLGKIKLPPEILAKQVSTLSRDERIIYESHVEIGAQLLSQAKTMPDDVLLIVLEHHERSDGSGFPKKLKDFQISPLARVVSLANAFVERVQQERKPLTAEDAYRVFEEFRVQRGTQFNREALKALEKSLNLKKADVKKNRAG
jgi:putative nucleotidyltransferase with HDIG domain